MPPPPPPEARHRRRLFDRTISSITPSISFSIPPPPFEADENEYVPITIQEIVENIPTSPANNVIERRRHVVRPYSLQLSAFEPTRELPRTPTNTNTTENRSSASSIRPFALQLFR